MWEGKRFGVADKVKRRRKGSETLQGNAGKDLQHLLVHRSKIKGHTSRVDSKVVDACKGLCPRRRAWITQRGGGVMG